MGATIKAGDGWRYTLTEEDKLWAGRMAQYEGGSPGDVLWTMTQGYARPSIRSNPQYPTFTAYIQAYSQPINPKWRRDGIFCRPGGEYAGRDNCAERRLAVRDRAAVRPWSDLDPEIRSAVTEWFRGTLPNPVPKAVEFAAPNVSESFLGRHPDARVIKRLDNWYIAAWESLGWPDGWVTMSPGVPWMAVGLAVLLGGAGAYAVSRRRAGRGLWGLEGTVAEHRQRAETLLADAERAIGDGLCFEAMSSAHQAEAESVWVPASWIARGTIRAKAANVAYRAEKCTREQIARYGHAMHRGPMDLGPR